MQGLPERTWALQKVFAGCEKFYFTGSPSCTISTRTGTDNQQHFGSHREPVTAICRYDSQGYDPGKALHMRLSSFRLYLAQVKTYSCFSQWQVLNNNQKE
jgi:hypothetical protein